MDVRTTRRWRGNGADADGKDLARIRAVADYIYETVERERALFNSS